MEFNPHARRKIDRLIVLLCRLELNLLSRANSGFIQAMAQTTDDAINMHGAVGEENQVQDNVTFQLEAAAFGCVLGTGFFKNGN